MSLKRRNTVKLAKKTTLDTCYIVIKYYFCLLTVYLLDLLTPHAHCCIKTHQAKLTLDVSISQSS